MPGSEFTEPADLVLIAIGFSHPEHEGALEELGAELDARGNVKAPVYATDKPGVFACGDARMGQSLVVTAIAEGRRCARVVDRFLGGSGETRRVTAVGAVRLRGRRPALPAPPGRDGAHRDRRRGLLVRPARGALGVGDASRRSRSTATTSAARRTAA